ncbi:MAG: amidohydrolase [Rhodospirillaceae bacterium]|nr:amidohydrolase [Rhodospirillaceae bacterium]
MAHSTAPDLVVINADIRTMDPLQPRAAAVAVSNGRVLALGDSGDIRAMANGGCRVVDAGGRLVLPGFQDTHIHLQDSGTGFSTSVNLEGARTVEDLQRLLRDFAATRNDHWVRGTGWYSGIFGAHNLDRQALDAAVPDRPVFIFASDGHNAAVNTKACEELGLDASVADPFGGQFVRDKDGRPTGLAYELAIDWIRARMPKLPLDAYFDGVRYGQKLANRHGITGVLDALVRERHMVVYRGLEEKGELNVRLRATAIVNPGDSVADSLGRLEALRRDFRSDNIHVHSAKFFLDGVIENRTAAMIEDYSDATGGNAEIMFDEELLRELMITFDAARFQLHVHVIGDRATRVALDNIAAARDKNGAWPSLHQLAHVQLIDPADIPRLRELGVVTNMQPLWARNEPSVTEMALPLVGEKRGRWMYPWRTIVDSGAPYAVSSDWGVSTLNPFKIMQTAVTRQPEKVAPDYPVFVPEERMTVDQVVRGYTTKAAEAAWRSDETGSLTPGRYADMILIDRDIFTIDPYEIGGTQVDLTLLGGREVHRAEGFSG